MNRYVGALTLMALMVPSSATAHIQVRPSEAAPEDPVLWTVLVPNERSQSTAEVELAVPEGVIPFSFEDQPRWKREVVYAEDKSIKSIRWTGRLASDGLAEFQFLASTPPNEGTIAWKALQTYEDGNVVRWIGSPDSEEPASVTTITSSVPRENAGGEGPGDDAGGAEPATVADAGETDSDANHTLALAIAGLGALLAAAALVIAVRGSRT